MREFKVFTYYDLLKLLLKIFFYAFIICACLGIGSEWQKSQTKPEIDSLKEQVNSLTWKFYQYLTPNDENVLFWLKYFEVEEPEIVLCQVKLESNNYQSPIFIANNNCLGMKLPKQRSTTAIGEDRGHAVYSSWISCLEDYATWQKTYYDGKMDYYQFLIKSGYAQDSSYTNKIKSIYKKLK
jgi:hypothetical protein